MCVSGTFTCNFMLYANNKAILRSADTFIAYYGTVSFITMFKKGPQMDPVLSYTNPVHALTSSLLTPF